MLRSAKFRPAVDGLESRSGPGDGFATPAAMIGPLAVASAKITGTIPMTAGVVYNPTTGLNLITAYGHGTISPFGGNTWVTIQVAQAKAPDGTVVEYGAMFIYSRYGVSASILTNKATPVLTPGSFTLPTAFTFGITSGPGAAGHYTGTAGVYSAAKGLRLTFG